MRSTVSSRLVRRTLHHMHSSRAQSRVEAEAVAARLRHVPAARVIHLSRPWLRHGLAMTSHEASLYMYSDGTSKSLDAPYPVYV